MQFANNKAKIICSGCPTPSTVKAKAARTTKIEGQTILVESDKSINSFKPQCIAIPTAPKPCNPKLSKWAMTYGKYRLKRKKALFYPNLIPCAAGPGVVTMVYSGQRSSMKGATDTGKGKKKCKWKGCEGKHSIKISYANNGVVKRKSLSDWTPPHLVYKRTYRSIYYNNRSKFPHGRATKYVTQRHHVIPCNLYKKRLHNIRENLKLLGYDINNEVYNGISLPFHHADIVWHNLQPHRGSHPNYDKKVLEKLDSLDEKCETYCSKERQISLWSRIDSKVKEFRDHIINWDKGWDIHSDNRAQRERIFHTYSDSKTIPGGRRKYFI